jgi:hypothetical protein
MNKERIAELLKEPARVAREDLAGLRELKQRYPWFSGAHLLLAMGEHASGEVLFDDTLRTTAAHIPSREVLWENIEETVELPPVAAPAPRTGPVAEIPTAKVPTPVTPPPTDEEIAQRILDQQILEAAAAGAYALSGAAQAPIVEPRAVIGEPPASVPMKTSVPEAGPGTDLPASEVTTEKRPAALDLSPKRFTAWLDQAPTAAEPSLPFANEAAGAGSAQDWLRAPGDEAPVSAKTSPTPELTRDLIDRFLEQTTPEPRKTEFFTPQQAGKRSVEEQLDIVTETLARIHEKQGHWAKAAQVYQRLAAKHPEKSGYFAALAKKALQHLNT